MRKKIIILSSLLFMSEQSVAFEAGQLSLDTPNVLKKSEGSFGIRHRFFGEAKDFDKFLGSDDGGNMHFLLKYAVIDNLLIGVDHTRSQNEYGLLIQVIDEGCGIDEAIDLFAPFKRQGDKQGVGLGLFLAKSAADSLGAKISLSNRKDGVEGCVANLILAANPTCVLPESL